MLVGIFCRCGGIFGWNWSGHVIRKCMRKWWSHLFAARKCSTGLKRRMCSWECFDHICASADSLAATVQFPCLLSPSGCCFTRFGGYAAVSQYPWKSISKTLQNIIFNYRIYTDLSWLFLLIWTQIQLGSFMKIDCWLFCQIYQLLYYL